MQPITTKKFLQKIKKNLNNTLSDTNRLFNDIIKFNCLSHPPYRINDTRLTEYLNLNKQSPTFEKNILLYICDWYESLKTKISLLNYEINETKTETGIVYCEQFYIEPCNELIKLFNILLLYLQIQIFENNKLDEIELDLSYGLFKVNLTKAFNLLQSKNADYASDNDPFKNFRLVEILGVDLKTGIFVRLCDKLSRVHNLLNNEAQVKDESIQDTCLDAINYCAILLTYIQIEIKNVTTK